MNGKVFPFCVGTSGWTYDHWKGSFYPEDLSKSKWFAFYATKFSAVEVNATFYRRFKDQTYQKWKERAPDGFTYVLKAPKWITHRKLLIDVKQDIHIFMRSASILENKLGLILLQLPPSLPYDLERLRTAILAFDNSTRIAVEFRHKRWNTPEVQQLLHELGATYCNVDSPKNRLTDILTGKTGYLRLHGRKRWYAYDYSHDELAEIAQIAIRLKKSGAKQVFIFFNNDFEGNAPRNAIALMKILEKEYPSNNRNYDPLQL